MLDAKLETLLAVSEYQNFTRAAEALSLTQPAVSHHIALLEQQLGVTLFVRGRGALKLTPEGEIAVRYARRFKALSALGFVELVYLRQSDNGSVSAGFQEVQHVVVILARLVTRVDELDDERDIALGAEKALHELRPTQLLALCRLGIAVAREVDKIHLVALKKVDGDSLSRYRADAGKILAIEQLVHQRRLADIGAPGENYLGLGKPLELSRSAVRAVEFNDIKSHKNLTE